MRVRVQNANVTTDTSYIWSRTGTQGNTWQNATVDIGQLKAGYKVEALLIMCAKLFRNLL